MDYTQITEPQRREMLDTIGVDSVDDLFVAIPEHIRFEGTLDLPTGASELELQRELAELASRNTGAHNAACFMGGGAYDHFIPAFIDQMISRGEFLTAYTPYQAEASQGSLQAFFEFQTQIARLTGLDVANASLYESATSTAEAVLLALNTTRKHRVLVPTTLHPDTRRVLETYCSDLPALLVEVPANDSGRITPEAVREHACADTACLIVQSPNVLGLIEDSESLFEAARDASDTGVTPLGIAVFNPISLGLLKTPGDCGADIATGEGQPLGTPLQFGGPYLGLFACSAKFMRKMPGRLVGRTTDASGRPSYCLTLQTREQHIRGAKATSNICTNQGLFALRATMYMSAMGSQGIREVARQCWHKAHHLASRLDATSGFALAYPSSEFFNEFVVRCPIPARQVCERARTAGFLAGIPLGSNRLRGCGREDELLIAVTEKRTRDELDGFADLLASMA